VLYGGVWGYSLGGSVTKKANLSAVDLGTGQPRWRFERGGPLGPVASIGNTVVLGARDAAIGLDFETGAQRWESPGAADALAVAGGLVLAYANGSLRALEPARGEARWKARASAEPVVAGGLALVTDGQKLRALDPATGREEWSVDLPPGLSYPLQARGDRVYLAGARALGSVSLAARAVEWTIPLESALQTPVTVADDALYFTTQDPATGAYAFRAFDPVSRRDLWRYPMDSRAPMAPVVLGGLVAVGSNAEQESLVALRRSTGQVAWKARVGSPNVQPVARGGLLFVAAQGPNRIYALGAATGAERWRDWTMGWPMGMTLDPDGRLLVSADNLALYAYRTD